MEFNLILVVFFIIIVTLQNNKRKNAAITHHRLNHKETEEMKEMAKKFIDKDCLVYTIASNSEAVKGVIKEVSDSGLLVDLNGNLQAVNLEYVTRIQEWPTNSKGKKKNILA